MAAGLVNKRAGAPCAHTSLHKPSNNLPYNFPCLLTQVGAGGRIRHLAAEAPQVQAGAARAAGRNEQPAQWGMGSTRHGRPAGCRHEKTPTGTHSHPRPQHSARPNPLPAPGIAPGAGVALPKHALLPPPALRGRAPAVAAQLALLPPGRAARLPVAAAGTRLLACTVSQLPAAGTGLLQGGWRPCCCCCRSSSPCRCLCCRARPRARRWRCR